MKRLFKILKWTGIVLVVLFAGVFLFVTFTWKKKYEAPYPDIKATTDSSVIARGKHIVFGPSHCATCHVPKDKIREVEGGLEIPLSGGWELALPGLGTFRAPNLTPDPETGIGKLTDGDLARTLRHGVGSDGRFIFPFMPYKGMADSDLQAVISFLRSQPPVKNQVAPSEYGWLGKSLLAFGLMVPEGPTETPPKTITPDSTAEYGKYLAFNVANCRGCHTHLDKGSGKYDGEDFAGGMSFDPDDFSEGYSFVSPNLTPDTKTGVIASWSEATFVNRFRTIGRVHRGSPMPWGAFGRMDDLELKALFRYLKTVKAVEHPIEKTVFPPGEKAPA